ncbi:hypothetical protein [Rhizobium sp. BR 315]|uniref:hypothetical protein n=1 Tax=Rhizobium sp. BR 315 TaxID=3040014 RepID=UPI003D34312B
MSGKATAAPNCEMLEHRFFDAAKQGLWPEARNIWTWPSDPLAANRFTVNQAPMAIRLVATQQHVAPVAPELFDVVGDRILINLSAGAACGWALAIGDPRVKAIIALEAIGSPTLDHPLDHDSHGFDAAPLPGSHEPFRQANCGGHRRSDLDPPDEAVHFPVSRGADHFERNSKYVKQDRGTSGDQYRRVASSTDT